MSGLLFSGVAGLLLLSTILSAAEAAVYTVAPSHLRTLLEEGFRGAESLNEARGAAPSIRATTFLLNTLFNLAAAGILVGAAVMEWGAGAFILAVPAATVGVVIVSEGIPRIVASGRSIRLGLLSAPLLLRLNRWMSPLLTPFVRIEELLDRRNGENDAVGQRELREIAELGRKEGVVEEDEHLLVERAFRMDELSAWDVMTPRVDIFAWRDSATLDEIMAQLGSVPYSRVPVFGDSIDDITGIVYVREAYEAFVAGRGRVLLSEIAREPLFVPGSLSLPRLLRDFQHRRLHMGIVADEFGGTDGLVTLEDLIEELVGEIEDETDISAESIHRVSRDEVVAEGGVELRDVNHMFEVSLPHMEYRSLNGFIIEEMGRVPAAGETMDLPGMKIEILEATDSQVLRARLRKIHPTPTEEP